jgi:hypothetical protein
LVPPDFDGNEGVQLTPNITPAPEGAHRRTRGNAFSMDLQLQSCSECSVRTTPLELVTKERSDYKDILRCHVWGCPVYVLEAKHHHDQQLPKWNGRARLGQFVGFSDEHSSMVANVWHLTTGYISPLFHVVLTTCLKQ